MVLTSNFFTVPIPTRFIANVAQGSHERRSHTSLPDTWVLKKMKINGRCLIHLLCQSSWSNISNFRIFLFVNCDFNIHLFFRLMNRRFEEETNAELNGGEKKWIPDETRNDRMCTVISEVRH